MAAPLLPGASRLTLDSINASAGIILLKATTADLPVACPHCGQLAQSVHSRYQRKLLDLPWQGHRVVLHLTCRKLFCKNPDCTARIFVEPLPKIAVRYAHKTTRLAQALLELVLLVGGEAASKIAKTFGLLISPDACLESVHRQPASQNPTPRVLGVDDFAFKRGHHYGTILVDMERRVPIDLLQDRDANTLADWLKAHPGVEIVTRDRASSYAEGVQQGAPQARQVADRWHLLKNLGDALERLANRHHPLLKQASQAAKKTELQPQVSESLTEPTDSLSPANASSSSVSQQRRMAIFEQVKQLQAEGVSLRQIARKLGMARNTILKLAQCSNPPDPSRRSHGSAKLRPFLKHLRSRWEQGERNATRLFQEIQIMGFTGSVEIVQRQVQPWRENSRRRVAASTTIALSPRRAAWLLSSEEKRLEGKQEDCSLLEALTAASPEFSMARQLALEFGVLIRQGRADPAATLARFSLWRKAVKSSGVAELIRFVSSLEQDLAAVESGLVLAWSNGAVEGQVNRLKNLKRQMYGRGSFDLLKARVLHRAGA